MIVEIQYPSSDTGYYIVTVQEPLNNYDPWHYEAYHEVDNWCTQTFGKTDIWGEEPVTGWKRMRNSYFFLYESHLTLFKLRWS